jgi:hypothetical protein
MKDRYDQATMAMTAEEFRRTIAEYGKSQRGASRFLGIGPNTLKSYATGRAQVPALIEITFALMCHFDVSPTVARHIASLPQVNYRDRRRDRVFVGRKRKVIGTAIKTGQGGRRPVAARKRKVIGTAIKTGQGGRRPVAARKPKAVKEVVRSAAEQHELIHERIKAGRR